MRPDQSLSCQFCTDFGGATRVRETLTNWQESWLTHQVASYRSSQGCEDIWWVRALQIEHALLMEVPLCGVSLDFAKCFDKMPHSILFAMARKAGMPEPIVRGLQGMYGQLERRFKTGCVLGKAFKSTNGILQGCPVNALLLNLFAQTWANAVAAEVPSTDPRAYADDMSCTADDPPTIQSVLDLSSEFARLTGMELNTVKTNVWSTEPQYRAILRASANIDGTPIPCVDSDRVLGAHLSFTRRRAQTTLSKKLPTCLEICGRIEASLLPLPVRASLVASIVVPKAIYGSAGTPCSKKHMKTLRAACTRAIWGQSNRLCRGCPHSAV